MSQTLRRAGLAAAVAFLWGVSPVRAAADDKTPVPDPSRRSAPRIMVVVPETLLGRPRVPDPAGETELIRCLVEARLQVLESSEVARIRYSEEMGHIIKEADIKAMKALCAQYHCDVFIAGEAFSEQVNERPAHDVATISARARIEVKAFIVHTGEILAANAAVAGASDLTPAIAGKTALQNAATKLAKDLVPRIEAAIDEGRVVQAVPWREQHPPYLLYGVLVALAVLVLAAIALAEIAHRRRLEQERALADAARSQTDPTLTGESYARQKR